MFHRTRTVAVLLSSAALAAAGAPAAAQAHHGGHHRGDHHGRFFGHRQDGGLAATAAQLGVTKDQLKSALAAVAQQMQSQSKPASFMSLFASQLGVTEDQLKAAAMQAKQSAQSKDQFLTALASALQLDPSKVTAAFQAAQNQEQAQWKALRDAFINALAQQLNISPDKVSAAFDSHCGFKHD